MFQIEVSKLLLLLRYRVGPKMWEICVKSIRFDISVKFHSHSCVGCDEIGENAVHWFKVDWLPKVFLGHKLSMSNP